MGSDHKTHIGRRQGTPPNHLIAMAGKQCSMMRCWQDAARTIPAGIGDPVAAVDWDDGEPFLVANPDTECPTLCADERGRYVEIKGDQYLVSVDSALDEALKKAMNKGVGE